MKPISHKRTGDKVVWHYKFSDLREFVSGRDCYYPIINSILTERNGDVLTYRIGIAMTDGTYGLGTAKRTIFRGYEDDITDDFYTQEFKDIFTDHSYVMPSKEKTTQNPCFSITNCLFL